MSKTISPPKKFDADKNPMKKRTVNKRARSIGAPPMRSKSPLLRNVSNERRCQSSSSALCNNKTSGEGAERNPFARQSTVSAPETLHPVQHQEPEKDVVLPQCVVIKMSRILSTKRREFMKLRKSLISQQNMMLEQYAALRELETRTGNVPEDTVGEIRIISVKNWPAHDLLLLVRDDLSFPLNSEIGGAFGPQVLQQMMAQLSQIPEDIVAIGAEIMARRIEVLNLLRVKHRSDRLTYITNLEWKTKNAELDQETEKLHSMVAGAVENIKAKINFSLELAKVPWLDRDALTKKIDRLQKENIILQQKVEENFKNEEKEIKEVDVTTIGLMNYQAVCEELSKEKSARESLKEVVSAAESMLRVARARIATLERQLKESHAELEGARKKHKDLEQLFKHRESSYDARTKKLLEVSKTGELAIETLSTQRDALELRVKELRDQAEIAERLAKTREAEQRARAEALQTKVAEQEKLKETSENRINELENKVKELEEMLNTLRERSVRLVDIERRRCLDYVPSKENEPSDRETEMWKELQETRAALLRAEEDLRQSRADKDSFLNSLSRIAQGEGLENQHDKVATELLDKEQKIVNLQNVIKELKENEKIMEQSMTKYENQLASLRLEVNRLRNYECYSKDVSYQDLKIELLELHMQIETLSHERTALVTAAASRALMLERHERAADLFARMTRARRDLAALVDGRKDPPPLNETSYIEVSRSLTSICATAADTWTALRAERARVLRLESAVLAQNIQLEREGRVRTQLERRRAILEREIIRAQHSSIFESTAFATNPN